MATCIGCGVSSSAISATLGLCVECLRRGGQRWHGHIEAVHARVRARFGLPPAAPRSQAGAACDLCLHTCRMAEGETSYCGLRHNEGGTVVGGEASDGRLDWYHDALPTNCVADWVCPGGTGAGYPEFAYRRGPETGYTNLAVFYRACSFDCLFCQNWHFRRGPGRSRRPEQLAASVTDRTACICYFGGDPGPQLPHAVLASELAREAAGGRILRICWETNGGMSPAWLERMVALSLASGGCVKFDLKAWDETLHRALCGVSNSRTLANFRRVSARRAEREVPPLLVASTLMVTGYVDAQEVGAIARFIASVDPRIPYALLAFGPEFEMADLPPTPRAQAEECLRAAREAGLEDVRLGNPWLLR
ncbi:MAG: radical SAM protein [Armatimonadota bacterium]